MLLETKRLLLRKFASTDFEDYCNSVMHADELAYMMKTAPIYTIDEARSCFDWKLNRESEVWYAICLKDENSMVIGGVTIHPVPQEFIQQSRLQHKVHIVIVERVVIKHNTCHCTVSKLCRVNLNCRHILVISAAAD